MKKVVAVILMLTGLLIGMVPQASMSDQDTETSAVADSSSAQIISSTESTALKQLTDPQQTAASSERSGTAETTTSESASSQEPVQNLPTDKSLTPEAMPPETAEITEKPEAPAAGMADLKLLAEEPLAAGTSPEEPILVSTVQELIAGLKRASDGNWPIVYLKLTNDLFYQYRADATDLINVGTDMVLDGDGHHYFYGPAAGISAVTARTALARFAVTKANLNLTFKNLHFGDQDHGIANYYGLVRDTAARPMHLYFDNVTYYANEGVQPFVFFNMNTIVSFSGKNNFYGNAPTFNNSEEWIEGNRLEFLPDSDTTIYHYTRSQSSFINARMGGRVTIDLKSGAKVKIETNKQNMVLGSTGVDFSIAKDADFEVIHKDSNLSFTSTDGTPTIFNMGKNSKVSLTSKGQVLNSGGVKVNVDNAAYFLLNYTDAVTALQGGRTWAFTRTGDTTFPYYWQGAHGDQISDELPAAGDFVNLNSTVFSKLGTVNQVIYHRRMALDDIQVAAKVAPDISQIESSIQHYEPAPYRAIKAWYKLSSVPLVDPATLNRDETTKILDAQQTDVIAEGETDQLTAVIGRRPPGRYYLYWKVVADVVPDTGGAQFVQNSFWQVEEVEVPKSNYYIEIPQALFFERAQKGDFDMLDRGGIIRNRGNIPFYFTITHVSEAPNAVAHLTSVLDETPRMYTLAVHSANGSVLGPLVLGENHVAGMRLEPFTDGQDIYLSGSYSGPTEGVQQVALSLSYRLYEEP